MIRQLGWESSWETLAQFFSRSLNQNPAGTGQEGGKTFRGQKLTNVRSKQIEERSLETNEK